MTTTNQRNASESVLTRGIQRVKRHHRELSETKRTLYREYQEAVAKITALATSKEAAEEAAKAWAECDCAVTRAKAEIEILEAQLAAVMAVKAAEAKAARERDTRPPPAQSGEYAIGEEVQRINARLEQLASMLESIVPPAKVG